MPAPGSVLLKVLIKRINLGLWKGKYLSLHASSNYKPWLVNKRSEIWRYFNKFTENEARRLLGCKKKNISVMQTHAGSPESLQETDDMKKLCIKTNLLSTYLQCTWEAETVNKRARADQQVSEWERKREQSHLLVHWILQLWLLRTFKWNKRRKIKLSLFISPPLSVTASFKPIIFFKDTIVWKHDF